MEAPARTLRQGGSLRAGAQVFVPGVYAWMLTVAPTLSGPSLDSYRVWSSWLLAAVSALSLALGAWLHARGRSNAVWFGIWGFFLAAVAVWLLQRGSVAVARPTALRGALGALAWGLYALGWGKSWSGYEAQHANHNEPRSSARTPRKKTPRRVFTPVVIASLGTVAATVLAWTVPSTSRSYAAQALALVVGAGMFVHAATLIPLLDRKRTAHSVSSRITYALPWGLAWLALIAAAVLWLFKH